jgi:hypothetical protein
MRAGRGGTQEGGGFLHDRTGRFYKSFGGGGTVNVLSHLGSSGVSLRESFFFLFLIYNYNIYEYKFS